ncbi:MAG: hypothetical protein ACRES4_09450, partial [Nevskiales bacterium]
IAEILDDDRFLFEPGDVAGLVTKLHALRVQWTSLDPKLTMLQDRIRERFALQAMAHEFAGRLSRISA